MDGLEEGADVDVDLQFTGIEMDPVYAGDTQNRVLSLALHVEAQAVARMERRIEAVVDAYSTTARLIPAMEQVTFNEQIPHGARRQSIREMIETAGAIDSVLDTRIVLGKVEPGDDGAYACEARVGMAYRAEDGEYGSLLRRLPVVLQGEVPDKAAIKARLAGEITAAPTAGGVELRFSVDFHLLENRKLQMMTVGGIQQEEWEERPAFPSVVLRRCTDGESLWDIAKSYNTTTGELCLANGLEDCETAPLGKLLLIPKKR